MRLLLLAALSLEVLSMGTSATQRIAARSITLALSEGDQNVITNTRAEDSTGARIWDAGLALSQMLAEQDGLSGKRVLELGSGCGIGGLTAAAAGAAVTLTDGAEAMLPLLEANIAANGLSDRAHCVQLSWGDLYGTADLIAHGPWDMIIGSDLLYAPEQHGDLLTTLSALCTPDHTCAAPKCLELPAGDLAAVGATGCCADDCAHNDRACSFGREVLLAYPTRHTEQLFFQLADEFAFEQLGPPEEVEPCMWASRMILRD